MIPLSAHRTANPLKTSVCLFLTRCLMISLEVQWGFAQMSLLMWRGHTCYQSLAHWHITQDYCFVLFFWTESDAHLFIKYFNFKKHQEDVVLHTDWGENNKIVRIEYVRTQLKPKRQYQRNMLDMAGIRVRLPAVCSLFCWRQRRKVHLISNLESDHQTLWTIWEKIMKWIKIYGGFCTDLQVH